MKRIWEIIILLLSVLSLVFLALDTVRGLGEWYPLFDLIICTLFIIDFTYDFTTSPNKRRFWRWGWIDLVSSLPGTGLLRFGRTFRMLRIVRLLRGVRSGRKIILFGMDHHWGALIMALTLSAIFALMGALCAVELEGFNFADAIWWSFSTVLTGSCEGYVPEASELRLCATFLMTLGKTALGVYIAVLAGAFNRKDAA